jgi:valyl-tRNA synthetase
LPRTESESIHQAAWPQGNPNWLDPKAEEIGQHLLAITTAVRRYKSEHNISLGTELKRVQLATGVPELAAALKLALPDLLSITRAKEIDISPIPDPGLEIIWQDTQLSAAILPEISNPTAQR